MAKTISQLKGQFDQNDPRQQNTDVLDALEAAQTAAESAADAALVAVKYITVDGRNLAGAVTATGAAVGDRVVGVAGLTAGDLGDKSALFEATITVVDEIQQTSATDESENDYLVVLAPAA